MTATLRLQPHPVFPDAFDEWRSAIHAKCVSEQVLFKQLRYGGKRETVSVALASVLFCADVIRRVAEFN